MPTINPYALQFGQEPQQLIPRESQLSEVVANFLSDNGLQHIYMIMKISVLILLIFIQIKMTISIGHNLELIQIIDQHLK